jgi:hypothetical protein
VRGPRCKSTPPSLCVLMHDGLRLVIGLASDQ